MNNTNMIKVADNFQSSVNIAFDLHDEKKIRDFITTNEAIELFEEFFSSTNNNSTNRAHILIGAYGKGKSHIILEILSILLEKDLSLFTTFLDKIKRVNPGLYDDVLFYLESTKKLLPIIISGSSASLSQSFLSSLFQTLKQNNFTDLMPDTNFKAAINTINKWKEEFPNTYKAFSEKLNIPVNEYIEKLANFDSDIYNNFIDLYPSLTSGSEFNPFAGFDIVELYEKVNEKLCQSGKGYAGIFVVYDEFSKYLESSITKASINDIKLLQDFAEKCCRSNNNQLHLLLISHKEITNYIDTLPKEKVDGWKGVSERFKHIIMHSDYSQTYELISLAIQKTPDIWKSFIEKNNEIFNDIQETKTFNCAFSKCKAEEIKTIVEGCYPLHPITTYILPRLSEKIAQNERTMFTFLSAKEKNTLATYIKSENYQKGDRILFITPDLLFDYFDNQMRSEPYTSQIKTTYITAKKILSSIDVNSLEAKLIKTIALVYCLNQFERLAPTSELIYDTFIDAGYTLDEIRTAIEVLVNKESFLYLRRSNNFLQLKETTGIDIDSTISDMIEKRKHKFSQMEIINKLDFNHFLYPVEYNTKHELTRYFELNFITFTDLQSATSITAFETATKADGIVLAILPDQEISDNQKESIIKKFAKAKLTVFIFPEDINPFEKDLWRYDALEELINENKNDNILCDEYGLMKQDISEILINNISSYVHPEFGKCTYYSKGERKQLFRKASFSHLLSELCEEVYKATPIINNETLNKHELTGAAKKSRLTLIDAILNSTEPDLGIKGGQELSFKRSSLCVPGILNENGTKKYFDTESDSLDENYRNLFKIIEGFIDKARDTKKAFEPLINELTLSYKSIGMREGVIPIFVAVSFSKISNHIVISDQETEIKLNADNICKAIENPQNYYLTVVSWSNDKDIYIKKLEERFKDYIHEQGNVGYSYLITGMGDWVRSLPKYSKEKHTNTPKEFIDFLNILKTPGIGAQEILFNRTKQIFNSSDYSNEIFHKIDELKTYYDSVLDSLENELISITKKALDISNERDCLCKCGEKLFKSLDPHIPEHKFENHAELLYKVFASCGNDEKKLVRTLAVNLTGINTIDWSESTIKIFEQQLIEFVKTLKEYKYKEQPKQNNTITSTSKEGTYYISYLNEEGELIKRDFESVDCSKKAKVLMNEINNILDEYGNSITDAEKRQVLLNIIGELTK